MGLVPYGCIVKTHGLNGEVCLITFSRDFSNLEFINNIYTQLNNDKHFNKHRIISYFLTGKYAVLNLSKIDNIEGAALLKNKTVFINPDELSKTDDDEYYWFELIGMSVFNMDGTFVGIVSNLLDRSQQSLLILKDTNDREILIPLVNQIVKEIDVDEHRIIIDPPEGLLDIN